MTQIRAAPGMMKASEQVRFLPTHKPRRDKEGFDEQALLIQPIQQLAMKQELDVLRRENRLMTSAFYDLSSRLQLNNVSLQRRSEPPRSWLNKQRQLVGQATAVRTR